MEISAESTLVLRADSFNATHVEKLAFKFCFPIGYVARDTSASFCFSFVIDGRLNNSSMRRCGKVCKKEKKKTNKQSKKKDKTKTNELIY